MADETATNALTPENTAALAAGATAALGALVFKKALWKGIVLGSLVAFVTRKTIDYSADRKA
jgi:hypothetical protein